MPKTIKTLPITGDEEYIPRLSVQDVRFIDAIMRTNGDKAKAYAEVWPDKAKGRTRKQIQTNAGTILNRTEIKEEIQARYAAERVTKSSIVKRLAEIANHNEPKYYNKEIVDMTPHKESVSACKLMAELGGFIDRSLAGANVNNIVINFPPMYSPEERKKMEAIVIEGSRLIE
jgi:hypothetical protein